MHRHRVSFVVSVAACVVTAALGFASVFCLMAYQGNLWAVAVVSGDVQIKRETPLFSPPLGSGLSVTRRPVPAIGFSAPSIRRHPTGVIDATIPLWVPLAVFAATSVYLWRRSRPRLMPGHCTCGYSLAGNTSGVCSECGAKVTKLVVMDSGRCPDCGTEMPRARELAGHKCGKCLWKKYLPLYCGCAAVAAGIGFLTGSWIVAFFVFTGLYIPVRVHEQLN